MASYRNVSIFQRCRKSYVVEAGSQAANAIVDICGWLKITDSLFDFAEVNLQIGGSGEPLPAEAEKGIVILAGSDSPRHIKSVMIQDFVADYFAIRKRSYYSTLVKASEVVENPMRQIAKECMGDEGFDWDRYQYECDCYARWDDEE